jgi:hypothetical protein
MALLDCEAEVEAHFNPFGDSANLDARKVHCLGQTYHGTQIILDALDGTPW